MGKGGLGACASPWNERGWLFPSGHPHRDSRTPAPPVHLLARGYVHLEGTGLAPRGTSSWGRTAWLHSWHAGTQLGREQVFVGARWGEGGKDGGIMVVAGAGLG